MGGAITQIQLVMLNSSEIASQTSAGGRREHIVILSAPLAQTLEMSDRNMSDTAFLDQMYQLGANEYFDVLFANAYGFAFPPEDPPDPERLNFQRVLLLREIMEKHGDD